MLDSNSSVAGTTLSLKYFHMSSSKYGVTVLLPSSRVRTSSQKLLSESLVIVTTGQAGIKREIVLSNKLDTESIRSPSSLRRVLQNDFSFFANFCWNRQCGDSHQCFHLTRFQSLERFGLLL